MLSMRVRNSISSHKADISRGLFLCVREWVKTTSKMDSRKLCLLLLVSMAISHCAKGKYALKYFIIYVENSHNELVHVQIVNSLCVTLFILGLQCVSSDARGLNMESVECGLKTSCYVSCLIINIDNPKCMLSNRLVKIIYIDHNVYQRIL